MKPFSIICSCLFAVSFASAAAETLPPLGSIPTSVEALWAGFDPSKEPLEARVIREWKGDDGVTIQMMTYTIGTFKGKKSTMGAYYAFPTIAKTKIPGILQLHGGGQRASKEMARAMAFNGYACISINWGGRVMEDQQENEPGTDWGALDATQQHNSHYASCKPDALTLDSFESPRNNNWYMIVLAARRALSFLEQQRIVDPARLGVHGHSMGGKLSVMVAGCDKRVKAAVPSCGGSGVAPDALRQRKGNAARPQRVSKMYLDCIDDAQYARRAACPIVYKGPQNDFNGLIDNLFMNWRDMASPEVAYAIAPHLNHRSSVESDFIDLLWFEAHLKQSIKLPKTPQIAVDLRGPGNVPQITITPEKSAEIERVEIFYSQDPNGQFRYWQSAQEKRVGNTWIAPAPIISSNMGFFAMANIYYKFPKPELRGPRWLAKPGKTYLLTSPVITYEIPAVQAAAPKATAKPERLIEANFDDLRDWYVLNAGNPHVRQCFTRKIKDPQWRGPEGAKLAIDVLDSRGGEMVFSFEFNSYSQYGRDKIHGNFHARVPIAKKAGWQTVKIGLPQLRGDRGEKVAPKTWQTLCQFGIKGRHDLHVDGKKTTLGAGLFDKDRKLRNLRWEGGAYPRGILMPGGGDTLDSEAYAAQFQSQIDHSIQLESAVDKRK